MAVCRQCGKTLPLLERFSGSGAFCSREHRQLYQEEYSRLALRRLLGEDGEDDDAPVIRVAAVPAKAVAVAAAEREVAAVSPPRVAPAIPANPGLVAPRRGGKPRLPALEWAWRLEEDEAPAAVEEPIAAAPPAGVATRVPEPPPVVPVAAAPAPEVRPEPPPAEAEPETGATETQAPEFASAVGASFWSRMPKAARIGVLGVALVLIGVATQRFIGGGPAASPSATPSAAIRAVAMGPGGWFHKEMPEGSGGTQRAGVFSIYKPSLELSDYRVEFDGRIEQSSLGWFVRFTDPEHYQAMKLTRQAGRYKLVRWLVFDGQITAREEQTLPSAAVSAKGHHVRVDVRGPRFTVQVDGQQIDAWSDDRLGRGGFGFLNEGDERGRVEAVQLFLLGK